MRFFRKIAEEAHFFMFAYQKRLYAVQYNADSAATAVLSARYDEAAAGRLERGGSLVSGDE